MEKRFNLLNREDWVSSGIQALKSYLLGVVFPHMSIEDCWSFVKQANKSTK